MDTLLAAGAQGAFSNRPSDVFGIQRDAKTPKSYNYSVGIQRDIGWGTVLDVTYAGFQMRNGEMATSINTVPDGAGSSTSTRRTPIRRTRPRPNRTSSCGRTSATRTSRSASTSAKRTTTPCRCSSTAATSTACSSRWRTPREDRRRRHGGICLQHRAARRRMERGPDQLDPAAHSRRQLHLGRAQREPYVEQLADARAPRRLAAVRGHGLVSGDWSGATTSTTDNFDFTGGDGGVRPKDITGDAVCSSGNCDPTPGGTGSYFNVSAFSRLSGRGDIGNAPVTFFRLPKIVLSNMSIFKNFSSAAESGFSSGGRPTTCSTRSTGRP